MATLLLCTGCVHPQTDSQQSCQRQPAAPSICMDISSRVMLMMFRRRWQSATAAKQETSALSQAGHCWAEVWCGPADTGRWVHVDVLARWLDEPGKVLPSTLIPVMPSAYRRTCWHLKLHVAPGVLEFAKLVNRS